MQPNQWQEFYFDAIVRLGLNEADARWHADKMMDQLNPPLNFTGYDDEERRHEQR